MVKLIWHLIRSIYGSFGAICHRVYMLMSAILEDSGHKSEGSYCNKKLAIKINASMSSFSEQ